MMWLQANTILDQVGHDIGFIVTEQRQDYCCKLADGTYAWLKDPKRWFVTLSDAEVY